MKAEDLMIGDWVNVFDVPKQIEGIRTFKNGDKMVYYDGDNENFIKSVTPIPLTEEILKKNGFVKTDFLDYGGNRIDISLLYKNRSSGEEGFRVLIENRSTGVETRTTIKPVKYVHEIQHTLKDLKIDREIVL